MPASGDLPVLSRSAVAGQLAALGVKPGGVLLVHTAFRAVRPVAGGPAGLIAALRDVLGPDGTLVMPSWTGDDDSPFDPRVTPAAADLGIVAETFRRLPGVVRSDHPLAFAAVGRQAEAIVGGRLPLSPHGAESAVGRVHDRDGQVLLLGVGHDANTTLHLAEVLAGVPYAVPKHVTVLRNGESLRIDYRENDHCCVRFALADRWLRAAGLQAEGRVGHAASRLIGARDIVAVVGRKLAADPLIFLHPPVDACAECDAARRSIAPGRA